MDKCNVTLIVPGAKKQQGSHKLILLNPHEILTLNCNLPTIIIYEIIPCDEITLLADV